MSNTRYLLVFGSLRRHSSRGYNCDRLGPQKFIRALTLEGYDLFSLGSYPAIAPGKGTLHCELHEVSAETAARVDSMERNAGYSLKIITLPEGDATIYMMTPEQLAGRPKVESGDWA